MFIFGFKSWPVIIPDGRPFYCLGFFELFVDVYMIIQYIIPNGTLFDVLQLNSEVRNGNT